MLYTAFVRSRILYASPVSRPYLTKGIQQFFFIRQLERILRQGAKFIVDDFQFDGKTRLSSLNLLPLFELNDILFFIKNYISAQNCFQL